MQIALVLLYGVVQFVLIMNYKPNQQQKKTFTLVQNNRLKRSGLPPLLPIFNPQTSSTAKNYFKCNEQTNVQGPSYIYVRLSPRKLDRPPKIPSIAYMTNRGYSNT